MSVDAWVDPLVEVFRTSPHKHAAHERAVPVLGDLAADPRFLTEAIRLHLSRGPGLAFQHYPVVSLLVETNPWFDLVVNCWIPLPDRSTDITTKAIHHHGTMLLTTVTAFGPGYEHWLFTPPVPLEGEGERFELRLLERNHHGLHHVAFVDEYVAHVPLYVPSLTVTVALWSSRSTTTWRDRVKRIPALQRRAAGLRRLASAAGLARALELKNIEYFDFFPTEDGFVGMRERQEFARGPNSDYVQSLLHVVQRTGNEALVPALEEASRRQAVDDPARLRRLLDDLRAGREIEARLSEGHYGIPFANFSRSAIDRALGMPSR